MLRLCVRHCCSGSLDSHDIELHTVRQSISAHHTYHAIHLHRHLLWYIYTVQTRYFRRQKWVKFNVNYCNDYTQKKTQKQKQPFLARVLSQTPTTKSQTSRMKDKLANTLIQAWCESHNRLHFNLQDPADFSVSPYFHLLS